MKRDRIEITADKARKLVIIGFPDGSCAELTPDAAKQLRDTLLDAEMVVRLGSRAQ